MSARVSLRGMLRLIRVDTLRRFHNVGFLVKRLIFNPFPHTTHAADDFENIYSKIWKRSINEGTLIE